MRVQIIIETEPNEQEQLEGVLHLIEEVVSGAKSFEIKEG